MAKVGNRTYSLEFKQQAAQLAREIGCTKAAKQLGLIVGNVQRWKTKLDIPDKPVKKIKVDLEEENRRLLAENAEQKKVIMILKAAAAFFSKDHLK